MKKVLCLTLILVLYFLGSNQINAQSDAKIQTGKYDRKSVTLLPLTSNQGSYYNDMIQASMSLPWIGRFDYNFISLEMLKSAENNFRGINLNTTDISNDDNYKAIEKLIRSTKILDRIIQLTGNVDSLNARIQRSQKRIVTSSSETMKIKQPSVAEMILLMNGTFIGVPILISNSSTGDQAVAKGHVFWYKLDITSVKNWDEKTYLPSSADEVILVPFYAKEIEGKASKSTTAAIDEIMGQESGETVEEAQYSIDRRAARNLVRQSVIEILNKDEFKVRGTIQDIYDGIRVDIGKREGVYLDQGYKVYELRQDENNKLLSEEVGFARIDNVGDNITKFDALSNLYPIIGSYEQGYTVSSHDQLFDISIKPSYRIISVPKEISEIIGAQLFTEDASASFNAEVTALYNTAKFTGINQLFIGGSFLIGYPNFSTKNVANYTATVPLVMEYGGTIIKKFWFMRFALTLQAEAGLSSIAFTGMVGSQDYTVSANSISFGGSVGLQFAASPDLNIGLDVGYKHALAPTTISYKVGSSEFSLLKDSNRALWNKARIDDVKLGGIRFGITVNYSIPM